MKPGDGERAGWKASSVIYKYKWNIVFSPRHSCEPLVPHNLHIPVFCQCYSSYFEFGSVAAVGLSWQTWVVSYRQKKNWNHKNRKNLLSPGPFVIATNWLVVPETSAFVVGTHLGTGGRVAVWGGVETGTVGRCADLVPGVFWCHNILLLLQPACIGQLWTCGCGCQVRRGGGQRRRVPLETTRRVAGTPGTDCNRCQCNLNLQTYHLGFANQILGFTCKLETNTPLFGTTPARVAGASRPPSGAPLQFGFRAEIAYLLPLRSWLVSSMVPMQPVVAVVAALVATRPWHLWLTMRNCEQLPAAAGVSVSPLPAAALPELPVRLGGASFWDFGFMVWFCIKI